MNAQRATSMVPPDHNCISQRSVCRAFAHAASPVVARPNGGPEGASTAGWANQVVIFGSGVGGENRVGLLNRNPDGKRLVGGDGFEPPTLSV